MLPSSRWLQSLKDRPVLRRVLKAAAADGQEVYLTGGFLRDRVLGRKAKDEIDLTLSDPAALVRRLARRRGESVFLMDPERDTYRLVLPPSGPFSHLDLTGLRAATIEEDLRQRDFTVNALAVSLSSPLPGPPLLDPTGGLRDGEKKVLRVCSARSFRDDPLRILRAIRLSVGLDLSLERRTRILMDEARSGLERVAAERVRAELFQILQGPDPEWGMGQVAQGGLLRHLGPPFTSPDRRSLGRLRRVAALAGLFPGSSRVGRELNSSLEDGVTRRGLLLLAAFLGDRDHAARAGVTGRDLMLGKKAARLLAAIVDGRLPRGWHRHRPRPSRRDLLALFHQVDEGVVEAVLMQAARLRPASVRHGACQLFLTRYRRSRRIFRRPPLLTGELALGALPLHPGRRLGDLLSRAREAQDLGRFHTAGGALRWARRHLN